MDLTIRPRRLRGSDTLRRMVRETRVDTASLIYPMFVMDGENKAEEISALPGQYRYTVDRMGEELGKLERAGVKNVMFFGIPAVKGLFVQLDGYWLHAFNATRLPGKNREIGSLKIGYRF